MRKTILAICMIAISWSHVGCGPIEDLKEALQVKQELDELKANLGDYQYIMVDPKLSFEFVEFEVRQSNSPYLYPELKYSIRVKQHNTDLKVKEIPFWANINIINKDNSVVGETKIAGKVTDGILAMSDIKRLYDLESPSQEYRSLKAVVVNYGWIPDIKRKPYVLTGKK